jgi:hypothetical protein
MIVKKQKVFPLSVATVLSISRTLHDDINVCTVATTKQTANYQLLYSTTHCQLQYHMLQYDDDVLNK